MDKLLNTIIKDNAGVVKAHLRAQELNDKYNKYPVPPILLEDIIEAEKLTVKAKKFGDSIVAELVRKDNTIYLTEDQELLTKWGNFALAHELGHWFLHADDIDYFDPTKINSYENTKDLEANCFAAYLLLPEKLMREYAWLDKDKFSAAFQVSSECIEFRKSLE